MEDKTIWPAETKEYAFQLWAYVCSRNAGCVARKLREEDRLPREMPHVRVQEAVAHWAKRYQWRLRVTNDFAVIAPDLHEQMAQEIILGARTGIRYLRDVVDGRAQTDDKGKVDGNRIRAALALVDRAGFTPVRRNDPVVFEPEEMKSEEVSSYTLTPEEIFALQARAGAAAMGDSADDGYVEPDDDSDEED